MPSIRGDLRMNLYIFHIALTLNILFVQIVRTVTYSFVGTVTYNLLHTILQIVRNQVVYWLSVSPGR